MAQQMTPADEYGYRAAGNKMVYTTVPGDTVKKLLKRFSISSEALFDLNPLVRSSTRLKAGLRLIIPIQ